VVAGPGALRGLKKCFNTSAAPADIFRTLELYQEETCLAATGHPAPTLFGRRLHLIDLQNIACECDKYSRVSHPEASVTAKPMKIKQSYSPAEAVDMLVPSFPPKWGLEEKVIEFYQNLASEPAPSMEAPPQMLEKLKKPAGDLLTRINQATEAAKAACHD